MKDIYVDGRYSKMHPTRHVEDSAWKASQVIAMLKKHNVKPAAVCEVGCGAGEILRQLHDRLDDRITYAGYEICPQAIEMCAARQTDRISFTLGDFLTSDGGANYDVLLALDVVEHVENYLEFIKGLKDRAEYKLFTIPLELNVLSILRKLPLKRRLAFGHIHHFSKETALSSLTENNYEIIDCEYLETAFISEPPSLKRFLMKILLRVPCFVNKDWGVRLMGGHGLIILAK